jgi:diamine N-acetyltransferase
MELTYTKAAKEDAEMIALLAEKIWRKYYADIITSGQIEYMLREMYSVDSLKKQMEEGHIFTIIHFNNLPIGYISISSQDNKKYFLHKFYIATELQAKGFGTKLLYNVISSLKNAEAVELTVNRKNYKAINFYFKNDFVIKDVADFDIGEGFFMNDFIMVRRLSE